MKFSKEFLREMEGKTIQDTIVDHSRWSLHHVRVFEWEGHYYETSYSVGATEQQDERPYDYEPDEIECPEVRPVEKTIIVYEAVTASEVRA